jgi:hypothetical protein
MMVNNNNSLNQKKEDTKNENNKEKKKKIAESLLDIELEDKKTRKHRIKKRKFNRNYNTSSSINSLNSSGRKDDRSSKDDISKDYSNNNIKNANLENKENKSEEKKIKEKKRKINPKKEDSIFERIRKEFPINDEYNINTDYIKEKEKNEEERKEEESGLPQKVQAPPQVMALMRKKGKLSLPLPARKARLSFREFGKGNLEVVEPGELVSSERLKLVKNNLKRNLTCNCMNKFNPVKNEKSNLYQSPSPHKSSFIFTSAKKYKEEIYPKLKKIFQKKDEGLFYKKKYFNIWEKNIHNTKKREMNLDILPVVRKSSNAPVIFLTKSLEENNEEETANTNDNINEDNNMLKDINKESVTSTYSNNTTNDNNLDSKDLGNKNIVINKEDNNKIKEKQKKENQVHNINFLNKKIYKIEPIMKPNDKLSKIYNTTKIINKAQTNIFDILKYCPLNNSNNDYDFIADNYIKLLDDYNKKIKIYRLFMLYKMFNENDDFYKKRNALNKWKKDNLIFIEPNNYKHIKTGNDHCLSCNCKEENLLKGQIICLNCNCDTIKRNLKNLLIKHKFLKEFNPIKYYLYIWHKNALLFK